MPRKPTGQPNGRPRKQKPVDGVNLIDTASEVITDEPTASRVKPPREQKAGPKKVLSETGKAIGDAGAKIIENGTHGVWNMPFEEAQSISHPGVRLVSRRLAGKIKVISPKVKMNPDDAADVEEIIATLLKYALRVLMLILNEALTNKEKAQADRQRAGATGVPVPQSQQQQQPVHVATIIPIRPQPVQPARNQYENLDSAGMPLEEDSEQDNGPVGVQGQHNPAFNPIGFDYGLGDGA